MTDFDSFRVRRMLELLRAEDADETAAILERIGLSPADVGPDYVAARVAFRQMRTAGAIIARCACEEPDHYGRLSEEDLRTKIDEVFDKIIDGVTEREVLRRALEPD